MIPRRTVTIRRNNGPRAGTHVAYIQFPADLSTALVNKGYWYAHIQPQSDGTILLIPLKDKDGENLPDWLK